MNGIRISRLASTLTLTAAALVATAGTAGAAPPAGDAEEPTWIDGRVATLVIDFDASRATDRYVSGFIVGPQDERNPQEPAHNGEPAHDHVLPNVPYGNRAICHPWLVVPGETATAQTVHVRDSGLAYQIDLGDGFIPLTSTDAVTNGLGHGLIALADTGFPPITCWTTRVR